MRVLKRYQYESAEIEIEEQIGLERRGSKKEVVIV